MSPQAGSAGWVGAHARSALVVAALAVEVGSFACAGALPDGITESTPVATAAPPDPQISEPSLQCPKRAPPVTRTAPASLGTDAGRLEQAGPEHAGFAADAGLAADAAFADASIAAQARPGRLVEGRLERPRFETPLNLAGAAKASEHGVSGELIVRCIITASGTVKDCCIVKGLPHVGRPAIDALQAARVRPLTVDGKPAQVEYTWTFRFRPHQNDDPAKATPSSP
jgi:TonB family protein